MSKILVILNILQLQRNNGHLKEDRSSHRLFKIDKTDRPTVNKSKSRRVIARSKMKKGRTRRKRERKRKQKEKEIKWMQRRGKVRLGWSRGTVCCSSFIRARPGRGAGHSGFSPTPGGRSVLKIVAHRITSRPRAAKGWSLHCERVQSVLYTALAPCNRRFDPMTQRTEPKPAGNARIASIAYTDFSPLSLPLSHCFSIFHLAHFYVHTCTHFLYTRSKAHYTMVCKNNINKWIKDDSLLKNKKKM